jgi:hypothetical protein
MKPILKRYAAEAIAHQDPALFNEISLIISEVKAEGKYDKDAFKRTRLRKVIFDRLGIDTLFIVDFSPSPNAYVMPPTIDVNHPLISMFRRSSWGSNEQGKALVRCNDYKKAVGVVDREKSKVTGAFSKLTLDAAVTKGMFTSDFTPDEIAAVILHELGHVFSYYECLAETLTTNYVLTQATREFMGIENAKQRIEFLEDLENVMEIKIEDKEHVAETSDADVFQTLILKDKIEETRSEFGVPLFDVRSYEHLSDQFSSRHGASLALASALSKLYHGAFFGIGARSARGTILFLITEIIKILGFIGFVIAASKGEPTSITIILSILFNNPFYDDYDQPELRLERIRRDLQTMLKDKDLQPAVEKKVLEDLDAIELLVKKLTDRESLWQKIWLVIVPGTRKQRRTYKMQIELEKLAANNLYARAAEFRQLQS